LRTLAAVDKLDKPANVFMEVPRRSLITFKGELDKFLNIYTAQAAVYKVQISKGIHYKISQFLLRLSLFNSSSQREF
jgi:hypothetical protein